MTRTDTIFATQTKNRYGNWEDVFLCAQEASAQKHAAMYAGLGRTVRVVARNVKAPKE